MAILEAPKIAIPRPREIAGGISKHTITNSIAGFLMATTGPLTILISVGIGGGLSEADINSWIFAGYAFGGVLSIAFSLIYRMPMGMAWTIPGMVLLAKSLDHLPFAEIVGAFMVTAALLLVLGITGWVRRIMDAIPLPIVMAMVAGVFLPMCVKIVTAFGDVWIIAAASLAGFVVVTLMPALARLVPPVLAALIAGMAAAVLTGDFTLQQPLSFALAEPILYAPQFSLRACLEVVVPMAITVVGIHNAQGFAISRNVGYDPPVNTLTAACGAGSIAFGIFGCVPTCVTGPVNGILNTSGPVEHRYVAGILFGVLIVIFGLFAPAVTAVALALPAAFIAMIGGFALLPVLQGAFASAFKGEYQLGAMVSFLVTVSDVTIFNIASAFWGVVFGFLVSATLERRKT